MSDVRERVARVLADVLGTTRERVFPGHKLHDDLGADSLDTVELAMALEIEFDLEWIDDLDMEKVVTVADLMDLTERAIEVEARKPAPAKHPPKDWRKGWWERLRFWQ